MSHELDFSRGYAAMFAHERQPVWHQQETGAKILAYHPTVEAALAEAALDYTVTKVPCVNATERGLRDSLMARAASAWRPLGSASPIAHRSRSPTLTGQ